MPRSLWDILKNRGHTRGEDRPQSSDRPSSTPTGKPDSETSRGSYPSPTPEDLRESVVDESPKHSETIPGSDLDRISQLIGFAGDREPSQYATGDYIDWTPPKRAPAPSVGVLRRTRLETVINEILVTAGASGLKLRSIHQKIVSQHLYTLRDGSDVSYQQVYMTVRNNDGLFEVVPETRPMTVRTRDARVHRTVLESEPEAPSVPQVSVGKELTSTGFRDPGTRIAQAGDELRHHLPKAPLSSILDQMLKCLLPSHPDAQVVWHDSDYRLVVPWKDNDAFLFDFSSKVSDGLRCGFVVDLFVEYSERRTIYERILGASAGEVEDALGCTVVTRVDDREMTARGMKAWTKISHHRRMGVYCIFRLPNAEWNDPSLSAALLLPLALRFMEGIEVILQKYPPPLQTWQTQTSSSSVLPAPPDSPAPDQAMNAGPLLRTSRDEISKMILEILVSNGGSAPTANVLDEIGRRKSGMFLPGDLEQTRKAPHEPMWRNSARWCRHNMVYGGLLSGASPVGIWKITDKGRSELDRLNKKGN